MAAGLELADGARPLAHQPSVDPLVDQLPEPVVAGGEELRRVVEHQPPVVAAVDRPGRQPPAEAVLPGVEDDGADAAGGEGGGAGEAGGAAADDGDGGVGGHRGGEDHLLLLEALPDGRLPREPGLAARGRARLRGTGPSGAVGGGDH